MFKRFFQLKKAILSPTVEKIQVGDRVVTLMLVPHSRARSYRLRLCADGTARVTIPMRGSHKAARDFVQQNIGWLEDQFRKLAAHPVVSTEWHVGTGIWFRGEQVCIEAEGEQGIRFGSERVKFAHGGADLRPILQKHLHKLAMRELPARVAELALIHGISVSRVSVRNQKSRWGSCSRRGTISLNWRLIQTPAFVRDYIILHELAHRRQMNHSEKFWQEVERLCPDYPAAEKWVKEHASLLR